MYIVGGIDIAVADQIDPGNFTGQTKNPGQFSKFLFHKKTFLQVRSSSVLYHSPNGKTRAMEKSIDRQEGICK
jgi:hypothetical protein